MCDPRRECRLDLLVGFDLDDNREAVRRVPQRVAQRTAVEQCPVVVFPQDRVGERRAVFHAAPDPDSIQLEIPESGCRLACVSDFRARARDGIHRLTGERRDA